MPGAADGPGGARHVDVAGRVDGQSVGHVYPVRRPVPGVCPLEAAAGAVLQHQGVEVMNGVGIVSATHVHTAVAEGDAVGSVVPVAGSGELVHPDQRESMAGLEEDDARRGARVVGGADHVGVAAAVDSDGAAFGVAAGAGVADLPDDVAGLGDS